MCKINQLEWTKTAERTRWRRFVFHHREGLQSKGNKWRRSPKGYPWEKQRDEQGGDCELTSSLCLRLNSPGGYAQRLPVLNDFPQGHLKQVRSGSSNFDGRDRGKNRRSVPNISLRRGPDCVRFVVLAHSFSWRLPIHRAFLRILELTARVRSLRMAWTPTWGHRWSQRVFTQSAQTL